MDYTDWLILNSLADFFEAEYKIINEIQKDCDISDTEIRNRISKLLNKGYISELKVDTWEEHKSEPIYIDVIYGMTKKGVRYWNNNASKFGYEKYKWDNYYSINYANEGVGTIIAKTQKKCKEVLSKLLVEKKEIIIDKNSIKIEKEKDVEFKYYKKLKRANKLTFCFIKKQN